MESTYSLTVLSNPCQKSSFPFDIKESYFRSLLEEGKILQSDGIDSIYDDVVVNKDEISHPSSFEQVNYEF